MGLDQEGVLLLLPRLRPQGEAATLVGPLFLRSGLFLLVLGAVAFGLYHLVAAAPYGSWLHG
ncbi:DUF6336 family protein [Streptomyces iakyrus]|uniref:DUF6336 family protein n=1 Tax=Streptomyces iakyrus TaxID=68219 RepID=UPI0037035BED